MFKSDKLPQSINFLDAVNSPSDIWANAYIWLVTVGKYLLIFVELVVLVVFMSRFVLDKRNNDLSEEINNKILLLSNDTWKRNSSLYANYQTMLVDVRNVREEQDQNSLIVSELISGVPSSLNLQNFSYNEGKVSFYLITSNLDSVNGYESALKNNPDYYNVKFSISKENSEISVRVTFDLFETEE